jgi:hypothetical protein
MQSTYFQSDASMAIAFQPTHALTDGELELLSRTNPGIRFERGRTG